MGERTGRPRGVIEDKFLDRFALPEVEDGCWEWIGYRNQQGYGVIRLNRKGDQRNLRGHVLALELTGQERPDGDYVAHHLCGNRACVNPDHLEWKTRSEHSWGHRGSGVCPRGHRKTAENMIYRGDGKPSHCKECGREASRRYRERSLS